MKKIFILLTTIFGFSAIFFQNCAKSVDLSQYATSASTVNADGSCTVPASLNWSGTSANCTATTAGLGTVGATDQISVDADVPSIGSATFTCTSAGLVAATGATCDQACAPPMNYTWTVAGVTCTTPGGATEISDGASVTVTANATGTNTGSATFACSANNFGTATNATCTLAPIPGCTEPATLSWVVGGVTCSVTGGQALANDQSVTVTATTPNKGTATFTCANKTVGAATNATCVASVAKPVISSIAPASASGCLGDTVVFNVTATGTGLTYQWYSYTAAATTPVAISGATTAILSRSFGTGEVFYYVVVSNAGGSTTSSTVDAIGKPLTSPLCGGGCFVAGTPVTMADGSQKAIEQIAAGDSVLAFNELTQTNYVTSVLNPLHHQPRSQILHHFTLADGRTFTSNAVHPIYVVEQNRWVHASDIYKLLQSGATVSLKSEDGSVVAVKSITLEESYVPVYNLEVQGLTPYSKRTGQFGAGHSYYVNGVLVHNIKE